MAFFSVSSTVRQYPRLNYREIKDSILGKTYTLSLVFVGEKRARALNVKTRKKTYVPNVLSFTLTPTSGEIYITPSRAKTEAKKYDLSEHEYIQYLYIHGLLHLKGLRHGSEMEQLEQKYMRKCKG